MAQMPHDDLEPLITECPSCQTRFRVSEAQLERAHGRVRCGACLTVFHGIQHLVLEDTNGPAVEVGDEEQARNALDALLEELAGEGADPGVTAAGQGESGDDDARSGDHSRSDDRAEGTGVAEAPAGGPGRDAAGSGNASRPAAEAPRFQVVSGPGEPAPSGKAAADAAAGSAARAGRAEAPVAAPAEKAARAEGAPVVFGEPRVRRPLVWLGIVTGVLLLIAQVLWYQFEEWAAEPAWRAVYSPVCAVLGCELPVQQDLGRLSTRNLVVRTHPSQPGVLVVNAVIVNGADFPQPFPVLELQFTTVRGSLVAARRFTPAEYLAGDAEGMKLIPRRTPVQIELTLDDPGQDAVNYRLLFR